MLAGMSLLVGWEFARLPMQDRLDCVLPARLPLYLQRLLHAQPALLRQLSHVKLRILARTYLRLPTPGLTSTAVASEDDLCDLMHAAIKVSPLGTLLIARDPSQHHSLDLSWYCPHLC